MFTINSTKLITLIAFKKLIIATLSKKSAPKQILTEQNCDERNLGPVL